MIKKFSSDSWKEGVLNDQGLAVVDFWHEDCQYCKMLEPIYSEVAKEYEEKIKFGKLDIRESQENFDLALKYGIMATPTLKFFCWGRAVGEIVGYRPKEDLKKEIEHIAEKSKECLEKSTEISVTEL